MATVSARPYVVYLLRCRDGSLYCGITNRLEHRLRMHAQKRGARYVASRLPFELVYVEAADGRSAALKREIAIKRLSRAAKLRLVRGRPATLRTGGAI